MTSLSPLLRVAGLRTEFATRARALGGYDVGQTGCVVFNG